MFLLDNRGATEKIVNLDNLVNIEIREVSPANSSVVCIMIDGRQLDVDRDSMDDCVKIVWSIYNFLNSQRHVFNMDEVREDASLCEIVR